MKLPLTFARFLASLHCHMLPALTLIVSRLLIPAYSTLALQSQQRNMVQNRAAPSGVQNCVFTYRDPQEFLGIVRKSFPCRHKLF